MSQSEYASASFRAIGTTAAAFVAEPRALEPTRRILAGELADIDLACSRFRPDSELALLNRSAGRPFRASALLCEAVATAIRGARQSGGAVDPTLGHALRAIGYDRDFGQLSNRRVRLRPLRVRRLGGWRAIELDPEARTITIPAGLELDLGATAKALAADRAARRAAAATGSGVLVNLGGDVAVAGPLPAGGWRVLVADDHAYPAIGSGQTVAIAGGGLATSSTTVRRWATDRGPRHHIVDPATGDSAAEAWRTVSVAAGSCVDANVAATAAIVRGEEAPEWLAEIGVPARLVRPDGEVVRVSGWPGSRGVPA